MPRALTEEEKCAQCRRLLEKGKEAVLLHGVRKVSVDDIVRAAGMAKGTFYQHFESKEKYLTTLIEQIHRETFAWAKHILSTGLAASGNLRSTAHSFFSQLFTLPEMLFFIQNEREIDMIFGAHTNQALQSFIQIEAGLFENILHVVGLNTQNIKPGVVHNYIHTLFLLKSSDYMTKDDVQETVDLILDSLIAYIFGGMP